MPDDRAATESPPFADRDARPLFVVLAVAATTVGLIGAVGGIGIGHSNHAGLLPVVRQLLDPSYLPDDFNIALRWHHHRPFALLVAAFSALFGETRGVLVLSILAKGTLAVALWIFLRAHGLGLRAYVAVSILLMAGIMGVGRGLELNTLAGFAEVQPPVFAHAALLLALVALARERFPAAAGWLVLAALFHIQIGLLATVLLAPIAVLHARRARAGAGLALVLLAAGLALALLPVLGAIRDGGLGEGWNLEYIRFRMPHHFELMSWRALAYTLVGGLALAVAWRRRNETGAASILTLTAWLAAAIGAGSALHFLDYHVLHWGWAAKLQVIRLTPLVTLFGAVAALTLLDALWRGRVRPVDRPSVPITLGVVVVAIAVSLPATLGMLGARWSLDVRVRGEGTSDFVRLARAARAKTPPDSVFLTPPALEGFTVISDRSTVVEFKLNPDGGVALQEWTERLRTLTGGRLPDGHGFANLRPIAAAYLSLTRRQLLAAARRYGARYAIVLAGRRDLPSPVHREGRLALVDLGPLLDRAAANQRRGDR